MSTKNTVITTSFICLSLYSQYDGIKLWSLVWIFLPAGLEERMEEGWKCRGN